MSRRLALVLAIAACGNDRAVQELPEIGDPAVVPARVRLLSDAQYANAVHDLLGDDIVVPALQTPGTHPHQFIYDDVLAVDAPLLVQYRIAAETIAHQLEGGAPCDVACGHDFAERAFRRPLAPDEAAELLALQQQGGFPLLAEAVLQAPSFVYRSELGTAPGTPVALTSYELAGELSFLFLDSIPDDALWTAARDETILAPEVLEAQVDRLLALPRVRTHLTEVMLDWLGIPSVLDARKDPMLYPELTDVLREAMYAETRQFVDDVLWHHHGSLRELLISDRNSEHGRRAGILTQRSVLTILATEQRESIIRRGMYLRHKFLCLPDPGRPPFSAIVAESSFTHAMTESQFSFFRLAHVYCSGCHASIDPAGRALHQFDALGRWRERDEIDSPIETDTTIDIGGQRVDIKNAVELAHALADSDHVARCVADQIANHAFGRPITDAATQGLIHTQFAASDKDLVEVFRAVATSPAFRYRRGAP